ncbi:MAG: hypothetical protein WBL23_01985 [Salinisphaera sp.]
MAVNLNASINLDNKSVVAGIDDQLTNFLNNVSDAISGNSDGDRAEWIEKIHNHFAKSFPDHGVMVIHKGQDQINAPENSYKHFHLEFRKSYGTEGFEIYVVRKGSGLVITNSGDGGFINWRFSGHDERDGSSVVF